MPVSNLRFDDTLVHGQIRTRDTKVVQMRPENLEANPPTRPITILCWLDAGSYAALIIVMSRTLIRSRFALQPTFVVH